MNVILKYFLVIIGHISVEIKVDPSGDPTMPSNRKFERGKIAKKSAEQIAAQREAEYEHYMNSEEGREAEAVLAEYRKKRGPTLVQIHQEEVAAKRAKNGTTSLSELRQKGFDRERVSLKLLVFIVFVSIFISICICEHSY